MNESDICTKCGICCTKSVFSAVHCTPNQFLKIKERIPSIPLHVNPSANLSQTVLENSEQIQLRFTCPALKDNKCSVYDIRPRMCKRFRCWLLEKHEKGEISYEDVMNEIQYIKELQQNLGITHPKTIKRCREKIYSRKKPKS